MERSPMPLTVHSTCPTLGKHSGRHAFRRACEQAGVRLPPDELTAAFRRFKALADTVGAVTLDEVFAVEVAA
jgi:2-isopropylmalate synthase